MKSLLTLFSTVYAVILLTNCTFTKTHINRESDKNKAMAIVGNFYRHLKTNDYERADNLFNKGNTNEVPGNNKLQSYATRIDRSLGPINDIKLGECHTKVIEGSSNTGEYNLVYYVVRGKTLCKDTFKLSSQNGEIKILTYNVMSSAPNYDPNSHSNGNEPVSSEKKL